MSTLPKHQPATENHDNSTINKSQFRQPLTASPSLVAAQIVLLVFYPFQIVSS